MPYLRHVANSPSKSHPWLRMQQARSPLNWPEAHRDDLHRPALRVLVDWRRQLALVDSGMYEPSCSHLQTTCD